MKRVIILVLFFISLNTSAQELLNNIPEKLPKSPPGTLYLKDSLFIDKKPITYRMYQEMLGSIKNGWGNDFFNWADLLSIKQMKTKKVDSISRVRLYEQVYPSGWNNIEETWNSELDIYSFNINRYNLPVTTITKEQADFYCKWRTNLLFLVQKNDKKKKDLEYKIYNYHLSSQEELELAKKHFSDHKQLQILEKHPDDYNNDQITRLLKPNKYIIFSELSTELNQQSNNQQTGMFRCTCTVKNNAD